MPSMQKTTRMLQMYSQVIITASSLQSAELLKLGDHAVNVLDLAAALSHWWLCGMVSIHVSAQIVNEDVNRGRELGREL